MYEKMLCCDERENVTHPTHYSTLPQLLRAFGISDDLWPPFAAQLTLLFLGTGNGTYLVRFLWNGEGRRSTIDSRGLGTLPGCLHSTISK